MIAGRDGDRFGCLFPSPETNQAKPVFAQLARDLVKHDSSVSWLDEIFPKIEAHLESWWRFTSHRIIYWYGDSISQ